MFDIVTIIIFSCIISLFVYCDLEAEKKSRYNMMIYGGLLPELVILLMIGYGFDNVFPLYLYLFFHISFFYLILIAILPYLRKHFSARVISVLWMIPNLMHIVVFGHYEWATSRYIIKLSNNFIMIAFWINLIGALLVIAYRIYSHLTFRKRLLKDIVSVEDENVLKIWADEIEKTEAKYLKSALVISNQTQTPLSIGLFKKTQKVVLPNKRYSPEELQLIFRHELIHICKYDIMTKFFFVFFTSICWYNPLMWYAMKKCYDDLELSCDESVLLDADENKRDLYANLILKTVAPQQGFTTCLSTGAKGLKYRLENIVKTRKKRQGAFLVAILSIVMMVTYGHVSVVYGQTNIRDEFLIEEDYGIAMSGDVDHIICLDNKALLNYIESLSIYKIPVLERNIDYGEYLYSINFVSENSRAHLTLYERVLSVLTKDNDGEVINTKYYISDEVDKEYLRSLMISSPKLAITTFDQDSYPQFFELYSDILKYVDNEEKILERKSEYNLDLMGFKPETMGITLHYSGDVDYQLTIYSWDYSESYTIDESEMKDVIELVHEGRHYELVATYISNHNELIEATYYFDIIFED